MFLIQGEERCKIGTSDSRRLRNIQNKIPSIIYGPNQTVLHISIPHDIILNLHNKINLYQHEMIIQINNKKILVKINAIQQHCFKKKLLHIDFLYQKLL